MTRTEKWGLAALLTWAVVLFTCGINWGLPSEYGWAGDELHPTSWGPALDPKTPNGWHARYPPLHFALLQALSWPLCAAARHGAVATDPDRLTVELIYLSRGVSLLMALATLVLLYRAAREVGDHRSALWAVFIAASVAPYVYYAKMGNLDVPYVMWFTLSLWMFLRILQRHRLRDYVVFAAAAAAAVCTKDQAYGLYTLAPIPILISLWRQDYGGDPHRLWRALLDKRLLIAAATAAVLFAIFQELLFDPQRFSIHLRLLRGPMSENYQDYANTFSGQVQLLRTFFGLLGFALNPVLGLACLLGLLWAFMRHRQESAGDAAARRLLRATLIVPLSYYFTFLVLILFCYDRYVLPIAIVLALFGGRALGELTRPEDRFRAARLAAAAVVALYSMLYAASVDFRLLADSRYGVEKWIAAHAKDPDSVVAVGRRKHIARFDWVRWDQVLRTDGKILTQVIEPEYIAIDLTDLRDEEEANMIDRLSSGKMGYRLALRYQGKPLLNLLPETDLGTTQRFINPEMAVFERLTAAPPANPAQPAPPPH